MDFFRKRNPEWPLRIGLGAMYLYSGYDILMHPSAWYWALRALPQPLYVFVANQVGIDLFLRLQGVGELVLAVFFLVWFLPRWIVQWVAFLAALEMALILLLVGVDAITFRDSGLLGAALALFILAARGNGATKQV